MNTKVILIVVLVLIGFSAIVYAFTRTEAPVAVEPTTFEECAALYPVMESYPRQCNTPSGRHFVEEVTETTTPQTPSAPSVPSEDNSNLIRVTSPTRGAQVSSPLAITGEARGTWYFEASFPIEIRNASGAIIATSHAEAQSDWMTEDFVPFEATITFPAQPAGTTGTLILRNDNASGDPERDRSIQIPITF